ncbi:MAG TPA: AAA family ATPase, partial [Candidatus Limnocylindria bacterium]
MRIERIHLDGFGRIANADWELPPGLTVFLGENEAGKSTLLNAIRALLFGFESTRNGRVWYPALAGGRRGGSLTLLDRSGGRWVVERHGEGGGTGSLAVRAPSGNQGGTETLDRLMHGADRELFRSIFAFGLTELSDLSSLSGDGVRGRIYGAATGLGGASAVDLEADLRERAEELFRPSGHKPALNALFARMDDLRDRIATLARAPEEHAAAHRERAEAAASAESLRAEADALRARVIRLERSRAAAPLIADLADAEARLAATDPALDAFPADAAVDADALVAARDAARTRRADLERSIAELDVDLAAISVDEPLLAAAGELRALDADRGALAGDEARRADAEAAAAREAATIADQLARTRLADETALLGLDDSIPAIDALGRHEAALDDATSTLADAERRLAAVRDDLAGRGGASDAEPALDVDDVAAALREIAVRRAAGTGWIPTALRRPSGAIGAAVAIIVVAVLIGQLAGALLAGFVAGVVAAVVLLAVLRLVTPGSATEPVLLVRAGLPPDASADDIERRRDELAVERLRRQQDAEARTATAALRARHAADEAARSIAAAARDEAAAAWDAWVRAAGLPVATTPAVARQVLAAAGI